MNLIRSSLRHNQVAMVTIFLIFAAGIYSLLTMPRRSDPEITIRQALVIAAYPGATASQVEEQVAKPIEEKLFTYAEIKKEETWSNIYDGLVTITVTLEDHVSSPDLFWQKLSQGLFQLSKMSLPQGVLGPLVDSDFGDVVALLIAVETSEYSYNELNDYIGVIENHLRQIKSVSKIDVLGYQGEEVEVLFNSARLAQFNLNKASLIEALQSENTITYSGYIKTDYSRINLYTTGLFSQIDQIRELIVGVSPEGAVVRMKDVATVNRKQVDPTQLIRVNGSNNNVMLISMEMADGYNIVEFGKEVDQVMGDVRRILPAELKFTTINNQPEVVKSAVNDFMREFLIAVVAVILTIMLMLPFNIALIAAISIPVSIGMTFSFLNLFGFELQQVSLASLIVVLGMVVDNAVVVIDAYVDKLDKGVSRFQAAWESATEFSVPLISSTLAIIMAFLPLVFMLVGATGEFLITLPITVAISMTCSLIVAFFLTPFLAYLFIKKGLAPVSSSPDAATARNQPEIPSGQKTGAKRKKKSSFSLLGMIQKIFDVLIVWAMKHRWLTIILGAVSLVIGILIMNLPKQQFFPPAERNQFVIQIFEPLGTKFDVTASHVKEVEKLLAEDPEVTCFAAFIGNSPPRVYYSFAPVFPMESYAMFLVNTPSVKETTRLVDKYEKQLRHFIPNAQVDVMLFAQGVPVNSPVEVRITGDNIQTIKTLGEQVKEIFRKANGSRLIRQDFEDQAFLKVSVNDEIANQMGFTTEIISDMLAAGLHGAPVSTLWEGDDPLPITFRLEPSLRRNFDDIRNTYILSPISGKSIPVRQIASLEPVWETGLITHRNGAPTLTTGCKSVPGVLSSEVLGQIQPHIDTLSLPPGYTLAYGGDIKNQNETFGHMIVALIISVVSIFLILLFEFKTIARPLIIMVSIPLTLFGSMIGLVVTGNVFSFTAFVGLIALVGIVIRNALIIVDHADHLVREEGISYHEAALESAKRRLRPIFLTTMAAAIGVVPMIIMKDPLWAPLASVFAFGIVVSMVLTLLVIPALYALVIKEKKLLGD